MELIGVIFIITLLVYCFRLFKRKQDIKSISQDFSTKRGTESELKLLLLLLKCGIPKETIFHDLYVRKDTSGFSQIDVVVPVSQGIMVFEVKDLSGWIFGNGGHSHWTQVLAYGKRKFSFYNPIKQNSNHIGHLKKALGQNQHVPFYSIIVCYGDCEFKEINYVPENTFLVKPYRLKEVLEHITKNFNQADYYDKHEVIKVLKEGVQNGESPEVRQDHVARITNDLGKDRIFD